MSSPRSPLIRLTLTAAVGALLTTAAVAPAAAGDGRGGASGGSGGGPSTGVHRAAVQPAGVHGDRDSRFYRGVVVARRGVALRSRPDWDSRVLRVARPGEFVWIFCRTPGWDLYGDRTWYLLADRAWAWAPARSIESIGPTPRWC